jgi:hypothetical protein
MSEHEQQEAFNQLGQSLSTWMQNTARAIGEWAESMIPLVQSIYDAFHDAYKQAGMPYDDTPEGLLKWVTEMSEIQSYENKIEAIKTRQWLAASIREDGRKWREHQEEPTQ